MNKYRPSENIERIVLNFNFKDLDDATIRLNEAILSYEQENNENAKIKYQVDRHIKWQNIALEIMNRIDKAKRTLRYEQPVVRPQHFSYLLYKIGQYFNNKCHIVECDVEYVDTPDFLYQEGLFKECGKIMNGICHSLIQDETGNYKDASVYDHILNKKKQPIITNPEFMINVPEEFIKIVRNIF